MPRSERERKELIRRERDARRLRILKWVVGATAAVAVVVLVSLAFSSPRRAGETASSRTPSPSPSGHGAVTKLLVASDLGRGFVQTTFEPQSLTDIAAGAPDPVIERARLESLGLSDAAIAVALKPPDAGGELAGTSITIQVIKFASPEAARTQLRHDREGALAKDFGIKGSAESRGISLGDEGFAVRGSGPQGPAGSAGVAAVDSVAGPWQVVVVSESEPGKTPAPDEALTSLARRQLEALG